MPTSLTAREEQVLIAVVKVAAIDSKSIDWAKVAAEADFNTAKQARDRFAEVRKKLFASAPGTAATTGTGGKSGNGNNGRASAKRKAGMMQEDDGEDEGDGGAGSGEEEGEGEGGAGRKRRKPKKPKRMTAAAKRRDSKRPATITPSELEEGSDEAGSPEVKVKAEPMEDRMQSEDDANGDEWEV